MLFLCLFLFGEAMVAYCKLVCFCCRVCVFVVACLFVVVGCVLCCLSVRVDVVAFVCLSGVGVVLIRVVFFVCCVLNVCSLLCLLVVVLFLLKC